MTKRKTFPSAAAIIREGIDRGQTDAQIRARVRRAFPRYRSTVKVINWGRAHPEWCKVGRTG